MDVQRVLDRIIRKKELLSLVGVSYPTWWRMERRGEAPQRVKISARGVGWRLSEIQQWLLERPGIGSVDQKNGGGVVMNYESPRECRSLRKKAR